MAEKPLQTRTGGPGAKSSVITVEKGIFAVAGIGLVIGFAYYFTFQRPVTLEEDTTPNVDRVINAGVSKEADAGTKLQAEVAKAQLLSEAGRHTEALAVIDTIEDANSSYSVLAIKAASLEATGGDAQSVYVQMAEIYPSYVPEAERGFTYSYELADLQEKAGNTAAAKKNYQAFLAQVPTDLGEEADLVQVLIEVAESKVATL